MELTPSFYLTVLFAIWLSNVRYSFGLDGRYASSTAGVVPFVGGYTVNGGSRSDLYWGNVNAFTTLRLRPYNR